MEDRYLILMLAIALLMTNIVFLWKERRPYREARYYNKHDVKQINHIIATKLPEKKKEKYLGRPEKWWFVAWEEYGNYKYVGFLNLNAAGLEGELEISGLTKLTELHCQNNALTSLKLSRLPSLTFLNCHDNQLCSLDLSGLPELTDVNCFNNRMISITMPRHWSDPVCLYGDDGPSMVILPKRAKLRSIYCQNNPLAIIAPPWRTRLVHFEPAEEPEAETQEQHEEYAEKPVSQ